jgi:hypothetical protein
MAAAGFCRFAAAAALIFCRWPHQRLKSMAATGFWAVETKTT